MAAREDHRLLSPDADVVITEGYKTSWFPKIEIVRKEHNPKPVCAKDPSLIGYVSDVSLKTKSLSTSSMISRGSHIH